MRSLTVYYCQAPRLRVKGVKLQCTKSVRSYATFVLKDSLKQENNYEKSGINIA